MKELTIAETTTLWKIIRESKGLDYTSDQAKALHEQALKLCADDPSLFSKPFTELSKEQQAKYQKLIKNLNKLIDSITQVEEKLLLAGNALNTDFKKAEAQAKEAIRVASGDPAKFDEYEKKVADYYQSTQGKDIIARKKNGEKVDHPKEILEMESYMKKGKDIVNSMANGLMVFSPEFRKQREDYIKLFMEKEYQAKFAPRDGQIQFRTVRPFGDYGIPENAFKEGLAPQFVSVWSFQQGIISKPYINDVSKVTGEKVGWTGGISSTSANLKFVSAFDFAASYGQQDGWIYAYSTDEAASVAHHITFGVGYDGLVSTKKGVDRSNAEAAMEYMVKFMAPERIVAARRVTKDGKLEEMKFNPNVSQSAFGDIEYLKFLLCKSVDELRLLEFLEMKSAQIKDKNQEFEYVQAMIELFQSLPLERQTALLELAYAANHALSEQLIKSIDEKMKVEEPEKYQHLMDLAKYMDVPKQILAALPDSKKAELERKLKETGKLEVGSHFGLDFEKEKRTKKADAPRRPSAIQHRFELYKPQKPVEEDYLKDVSKIKPRTEEEPSKAKKTKKPQ